MSGSNGLVSILKPANSSGNWIVNCEGDWADNWADTWNGSWHGQSANSERIVSRYFNSDWYAWQDPDCKKFTGNVYQHYQDIGRHQLRDPSPMFDAVRYSQTVGKGHDPSEFLNLVESGLTGRSFGIYESWEDLLKAQADFHASLETIVHKVEERTPRHKNLVLLQAGPASIHGQWYLPADAEFDLMFNYYDATDMDLSAGQHVFSQLGTKFTGFDRIVSDHLKLIEKYDYVFLLDDDIHIDTSSINRLFDLCHAFSLDAAQPSLSSNSHCIWDVFFNKGSGLRYVNGVEIMMPVLSRRAIRRLAGCFSETVSGFGLDLLLGKKISNELKGKLAVIDDVQAIHDKPINDKSGAYYNYMRQNLINPKAELWHLYQKYDLDLEFHEVG